MTDRFYFRQLLAGHDFARDDQIAQQMVNYCYLIGDRERGEAVAVDPAYRVARSLRGPLAVVRWGPAVCMAAVGLRHRGLAPVRRAVSLRDGE